jgi:hypothetical protein
MQKQNVSKKSQIITEEAARDLTTVNLLMQKHNVSQKWESIMGKNMLVTIILTLHMDRVWSTEI